MSESGSESRTFPDAVSGTYKPTTNKKKLAKRAARQARAQAMIDPAKAIVAEVPAAPALPPVAAKLSGGKNSYPIGSDYRAGRNTLVRLHRSTAR